MKKLALTIAVGCLLAAFVLASSANSQEPAPDYGDASPLLAACSHLSAVGENEGIAVRSCRRVSPDQLNGNRALVHIRLRTSEGPFEFIVEMRKSLWHTVAWK